MANMKLSMKIGLGYTLIALLLVVSVLTTIWQVRKTNFVTNRIIDLRSPTAQSSLMMLNGINHSLAALRGWIILGKDTFREERANAWSLGIEPPMEAMKKFSLNWTDPNNIERLNNIEETIGKFKKYQQEIEDIAQTVDNTPATKILFEQAAPQAEILAVNITKMIDLEKDLKATAERKALLGMMADVRGTTGLALANIRAYLLSGDQKFKEKFDKLWAKNTRRFGDLASNTALLIPDQLAAFDAFSQARKIFDPLPAKMFEIRGSNKWNLANAWLGEKAAPTASSLKKNLEAMVASQKQLMETDMVEAKRLTSLLNTVEWILLAAGILFSGLLGILITRSIAIPITRIVKGLRNGSEQTASASNEISSASQSLAQGASEQAASIEETSASLEEMASMSKLNADNAQQASTLANQASSAAGTGSESMKKLVDGMGRINNSSREVSKVAKAIEEIAFQTNLLALNAAVEAARAGEAGAGFAVVAEEVRNLAQRASEQAKTTSELINESTELATQGTKQADDANKALEDIITGVQKVTELITEITTASGEQAKGVDQVNVAVSEMDKVVQDNAANAEETAASSEELSAQAESMNAMVGELNALVAGSTGDSQHADQIESVNQVHTTAAKGFGSKVHNLLRDNAPTSKKVLTAKATPHPAHGGSGGEKVNPE